MKDFLFVVVLILIGFLAGCSSVVSEKECEERVAFAVKMTQIEGYSYIFRLNEMLTECANKCNKDEPL